MTEGNELGQIERKWSIHKSIGKIADMWAIIKDGMDSEVLWKDLKMKMLLQDVEASQALPWGKVYSSDTYVYDKLKFRTEIGGADSQEDMKIKVNTNTSNQTIKLFIEGEED